VLAKLEAGDRASPAHHLIDDLPLFSAAARPAPSPADPAAAAILKTLAGLNPDEMTPREALEALYALKQAAAKKSPGS
jgi:DNA mismatch repair protein MutS